MIDIAGSSAVSLLSMFAEMITLSSKRKEVSEMLTTPDALPDDTLPTQTIGI